MAPRILSESMSFLNLDINFGVTFLNIAKILGSLDHLKVTQILLNLEYFHRSPYGHFDVTLPDGHPNCLLLQTLGCRKPYDLLKCL